MSIQLREFLASDYPMVRALWEATPGVGLSEGDTAEGVARVLERNPGLSWLAVADGELAGVVLCGHDGRRGMMYHLVVKVEFRRQGIASQLVHAAFSGLRNAGIEQCYAMVYKTNTQAQVFWKGLGAIDRIDLTLLRTPIG
jgi:putative acetyltransferase